MGIRWDYWRPIINQAAREGRVAVREHWGRPVTLVITAILGAVAILRLGSPGAWMDKLLELAAALVLILAFFGLWFVWRLLTIPAEKDAQQVAELVHFRHGASGSSAASEHARVAEGFRRQLDDADALRDFEVVSEDDLQQLLDACNAWVVASADFLRANVSHLEAHNFTKTPLSMPGGFTFVGGHFGRPTTPAERKPGWLLALSKKREELEVIYFAHLDKAR